MSDKWIDRKECKYWNNWYCMFHRKAILIKESRDWCQQKCKEFIDKNVPEKKTRGKKK